MAGSRSPNSNRIAVIKDIIDRLEIFEVNFSEFEFQELLTVALNNIKDSVEFICAFDSLHRRTIPTLDDCFEL